MRLLSFMEETALLQANPSLADAVKAHVAYVQRYGWNQIQVAQQMTQGMTFPIPPWGVVFTDRSQWNFGKVLLFPKANGDITVSQFDSPQQAAQIETQLNKPVMHPDTDFTSEMIRRTTELAQHATDAAADFLQPSTFMWIAVAVVGMWALSKRA